VLNPLLQVEVEVVGLLEWTRKKMTHYLTMINQMMKFL